MRVCSVSPMIVEKALRVGLTGYQSTMHISLISVETSKLVYEIILFNFPQLWKSASGKGASSRYAGTCSCTAGVNC